MSSSLSSKKNPRSTGHKSPLHYPCKWSHLLTTVTMSQAHGKVTICKVPLSSLKISGKMPNLWLLLPSISLPCQTISRGTELCSYGISYVHLARSCPTSAYHAQLLNLLHCRLFRQVSSLVKQWVREDYFHACGTDAKKKPHYWWQSCHLMSTTADRPCVFFWRILRFMFSIGFLILKMVLLWVLKILEWKL